MNRLVVIGSLVIPTWAREEVADVPLWTFVVPWFVVLLGIAAWRLQRAECERSVANVTLNPFVERLQQNMVHDFGQDSYGDVVVFWITVVNDGPTAEFEARYGNVTGHGLDKGSWHNLAWENTPESLITIGRGGHQRIYAACAGRPVPRNPGDMFPPESGVWVWFNIPQSAAWGGQGKLAAGSRIRVGSPVAFALDIYDRVNDRTYEYRVTIVAEGEPAIEVVDRSA